MKVIFIFRLYSLYGGSLFVLGSISALLIAEMAVKIVSPRLFFRMGSTHQYNRIYSGRLQMARASYYLQVCVFSGISEKHTNLRKFLTGLVGCILTGKDTS